MSRRSGGHVNSVGKTHADRTRPGVIRHDLADKAEPLRCGVCGNPSARPVCRKCAPLVSSC